MISVRPCALKQRRLGGKAAAAEVTVGKVGDFAAARGALYEPFLDEERLIHFLNGAGVFSECRGNGGKSHGTTFEFVDNRGQYLVVDLVEAVTVDVEGFEGKACNFAVYRPVAFHLGKVAHTAQQSIGNARGAAAAQGYLGGGIVGDGHREQPCRPLYDALQYRMVIIFKVAVDAKPRPERRCEQPAAGSCPDEGER